MSNHPPRLTEVGTSRYPACSPVRRRGLPSLVPASAVSGLVALSSPKMAAMALRRVCASRSISARTWAALRMISGSVLVFSIQCSKATRVSSVAVRQVALSVQKHCLLSAHYLSLNV